MEIRTISEQYFQTMRIPVSEGRGILKSDATSALPVAVINETLARRWWKGKLPLAITSSSASSWAVTFLKLPHTQGKL